MKETMRERYERIVEQSRSRRRYRWAIGVVGSIAAIATAAALTMPAIAAVQGQFDDPAATSEQPVEQPMEQTDPTATETPIEGSSTEKNVDAATTEEQVATQATEEPVAETTSQPEIQPTDNSDISPMAEIPGEHVDGGTFMGPDNNELTWEVTENDAGERTLTISGTGPMPDFSSGQDTPWAAYCAGTEENPTPALRFAEGVTSIGAKAFSGLSIASIDFGPTVASIGSSAFSYGKMLSEVTIPGNVKTVGESAFAYNNHLKKITIEDGVETLETWCFVTSAAYSGTFPAENSNVYIPASVKSLRASSFAYATSYEVSPDNENYASEDGVLYTKDKTTLVAYPFRRVADEYRVPEYVTTISSGAFSDPAYSGAKSVSTKRVVIPSTVTSIPSEAFNGSDFEEIIIEDGVPFTASGLSFYACPNLRVLQLPEDADLTFNGTFSRSQLQEFTFPAGTVSIGSLFYIVNQDPNNCLPSLETVRYNAKNANITSTSVFPDHQPYFQLVIGSDVDVLPSGFDAIVRFQSEIQFEPNNQMTIEAGAFASAEEPLASLSGTVYVDDQGILYSYDAQAGTATLVNIPDDVIDAQIPAALTPEPDVTVTVTGVAQGAAKHADLLKTVTFEKPESITNVALYAFANCPSLVEMNGKKTVDEVRNTFSNATFGANPFYNTGLSGASGVGGFSNNMHGQEALTVSGTDVDPLHIELKSAGETITWEAAEDGNGGGYRLLTGDTLTITASVGNETGKEGDRYRVYLRLDGEDATLSVSPGDTIEYKDPNTDEVIASGPVYATSDPYTIYVEFTRRIGGTISLPLTAIYPTPSSSGGGLTIWGIAGAAETKPNEAYEGELVEPDGSNVIQAYWTTEPDAFNVSKENGNTNNTVGVTGDGNGAAVLASDINWTVRFAREDETSSYGKDFVRSVDFVDTPQLPVGVTWDPEVLEDIKNGNTRFSGSNLYAGDTLIASITASGITGRRAEWNGESQSVELHWRYANGDRNSEISIPNVAVSLKAAAFSVDLNAFNAATDEHVFNNSVKTNTHYTHSKDVVDDATESVTLNATESNLVISKSSDTVSYFGEDIDYDITVANNGAAEFIAAQVGSYTVTDTLSAYVYLKPENIQKMFEELPEGASLTITISNATLGNWTEVKGADGSSTSWRTPGNSVIANGQEGQTLVITASSNGGYDVAIQDGTTHHASSVEEALRDAGYAPTKEAQYSYVVALNGPESAFTLNGGSSIDLTIHATAKTSFELLGTDRPAEYPEETTLAITNTAVLKDAAGKQVGSSAQSRQQTVKREAMINKYVMRDGEVLSSAPVFNEGDILDYVIDFDHFGSGTYENLPMVDDLYGGQYLLVPAIEENSHLVSDGQSLEKVTADGAEYYILTEGTYTDVKIGYDDAGTLLTAATVTVASPQGDETVELPGEEEGSTTTQTYSGIHTKISWYFSELPGEEYRMEVRYKALVSSEAADGAGGFSVGNVVWMNDLPGRRITAGLWGGGSILNFKKNIVDGGRAETPGQDSIIESDYSLVGPGEKVTYRLDLRNDGTGSYTLTGAELADALPQTFGSFQWDKSMVRVEAVCDGVELEKGFNEWTLSDSYAGSGASQVAGQQYITWPDNTVIAKFGSNSKLYIYVTLTFPSNTAEDAAWDNYAEAAGGAQVQNTLWVCGFASNVTHDLEQRGNALVQKGVYATYLTGISESGAADPESNTTPRSERNVFNNADTRGHWVQYYAVVMNTGNARLYLNDLYDRLPQGFTFGTLRSTASGTGNARRITTRGGANETATFDNQPFVDLSYVAGGGTDDVRYKSASVTVASNENGVVRLSFGAGEGADAVKYDEARDQYYLDRDEAIVFGYLCSVGYYSQTLSTADNALAMPYEDYLGTGVVATGSAESDQNLTIRGDDFVEGIGYNDGSRLDLDAEEVQSRWNLTDDGGDARWLASEVTMQRSYARPGVSKKAVSYTIPGNDDSVVYEGSASPEAVINWETTLLNEGPSQIMDYTVADTIEAPYTFVGDMVLTATTADGVSATPVTLFSIASHNATDETVSFTRGTTTTKVTMNAEDWTKIPNANDKTGSVAVKIANTEEGEQLSIRLLGSKTTSVNFRWMIPEDGGKVTLTYHTENTTHSYSPKPYINDVYLEPDCDFTDTSLGNLIRDEEGNPIGVANSAPVNIAFGVATSSDKAVTEAVKPENTASATGSSNVITLASSESKFIYDLTVNNISDQAFNRMVIIDSLPQEGDTSPFNPDVERGSQFKVRFANDAKVTVSLIGSDETELQLSEDQYRVEYSNKITFEENDWNGVRSNDWTGFRTDARSLRVVLENEEIVPDGATVKVSFTAVVEGEAAAGSIAWNSFGYRYTMPGSTDSTLSAVSLPVGVKVPTVPKLVKRIVDEQGNEVVASKTAEFNFAVYAGEALEGHYETIDALNAALAQANREKARTIEVTVPEGKSVSDIVSLAFENWTWVDGAQYTVTELGSYEDFAFHDFNNIDADHYTFTYNPATEVTLTCHNLYARWNLTLIKVDGDKYDAGETSPLSGAVFALYSPEESDWKTVADIAEEKNHPEYKEMGISEIAFPDDASREGWLTDIVTLDETGSCTWENLARDRYYLLEVKAPDGYNLPDNPGQIVYRSSAEVGGLEVEIPNYRGAILPETGGSGTTPYIAAGTALMAAAYVIHRMRRRRREGRA